MSLQFPFIAIRPTALLTAVGLCASLSIRAADPAPVLPPTPTIAPGPWVPDQGNGTYRNPVLFADYSDPDAIRVGDDYWLTASSFNEIPGLPILHSRDLVNWTLVNHALPVLPPHDYYSTTRHGLGVYAPSIRHHAGKFWVFFPDPDYGIYVVTAEDPRGKWSEPLLVQGGKGYIDPCPFWDDDGKAYLVCGWAGSRGRRANLLTLYEMSPDGTKLIGDGKTIIDGRDIGWKTVEGPKLYKRDGYYWVFAPAGGVGGGFQAVYRSRNIWGPYENRNVLEQGTTKINGPHQGAWVDTPNGENWFLHFQKDGAYGRVVHLQPMQWRPDGWPVMGSDPNGTGKGEPVSEYKKPGLPAQPVAVPVTSDEFDQPALGLQWQWEANPSPGWWSLSGNPGSLRLNCVPLGKPNARWVAPNLLMQKFPAPTFTATTLLRFSPKSEDETAGLIVFGRSYAWLGLCKTNGRVILEMVTGSDQGDNSKETVAATAEPKDGAVYLRVSVANNARCQFAWSNDGVHFTNIGKGFAASSYGWVGAKVGIFATAAPPAPIGVPGATVPATAPVSSASATSDVSVPGHADFDWFRVEPL